MRCPFVVVTIFQSTHPVRGATIDNPLFVRGRVISIHAPREGCDATRHNLSPAFASISIYAPREGCDAISMSDCVSVGKFQSTHPVRGATVNIPAPQKFPRISIHAPREGCDKGEIRSPVADVRFQSTHPVRGATTADTAGYATTAISIHAPREGCDVKVIDAVQIILDFNPRTP